MKTITGIHLTLLFCMLLFGCNNSTTTTPPSSSVDIRGMITSIARGAQSETGSLGTIMVEGAIESDTEYDKASIRISDETKIFERRGGKDHPIEFDALREGLRVEAEFTGPVMESYPVQVMAARVVVLEPSTGQKGNPTDTTGQPQAGGDGNFTLYVSNQSTAVDPVDITIIIDGDTVVAEDFLIGNHHNWKAFSLTVPQGEHTLKAITKKGNATLEDRFKIDGKLWGVVDYWQQAAGTGSQPGFTFHTDTKPIMFQ